MRRPMCPMPLACLPACLPAHRCTPLHPQVEEERQGRELPAPEGQGPLLVGGSIALGWGRHDDNDDDNDDGAASCHVGAADD